MYMKQADWVEEKQNLISLSTSGKTLKEIGEAYGVSKQRIKQVMQLLGITIPRNQRGASLRVKLEREEFLSNLERRIGRKDWYHKDDLSKAMVEAFRRKKQNVRTTPWEWTITFQEVEFPLVCPILGIELDWFADYRAENSPSFDRVDSTKGYIPGNVIICSWRANRIKNDGTAEEHKKIAEFLYSFQEQ